jgi:hypothetical protein
VEQDESKFSYRANDSSITNYVGDVPFNSKEKASFSLLSEKKLEAKAPLL